MPGMLPPRGQGLVVGEMTRHSYLQPHVHTHIFFKTDKPYGIRELATLLGLEANTVMSPHPHALYVESGEPGEIYVPAMWYASYSNVTIFAVLMEAKQLLKQALEFATPTWPDYNE